jgi:O-antigen/teichoic acid export membrane protein
MSYYLLINKFFFNHLEKILLFIFVNASNFINFLFLLVISNNLSIDSFAKYSIINSIVIFPSLFFSVFHFSISKQVITANVKKRKTVIAQYILQSIYLSLIASILTLIIFLIRTYFDQTLLTINILGIIFLVLLPFSSTFIIILLAIINGLAQHRFYSYIILLSSIGKLLLLFFLFFHFKNYLLPFTVNIITIIVVVLIILFFLIRKNLVNTNFFLKTKNFLPDLKIILQSINKYFLINHLIISFYMSFDIFFFSLSNNYGLTGEYAAYSSVSKIFFYLLYPILLYLFPQFSDTSIGKSSSFNLNYIKILFVIKFFFILSVLIFSKFIFYLFFGKDFEVNIYLLIFPLIAFSLLGVLQLFSNLLLALNNFSFLKINFFLFLISLLVFILHSTISLNFLYIFVVSILLIYLNTIKYSFKYLKKNTKNYN